ncbi:carboxypeptidase-like regulatory domain-containing protein [Chitinophaga pinensis]|uniref:Carboxypeptidase-like protein n=1 Tax=Chitinophaga pinensis (strain ATCC 43595 / DSM 2588 / LMG 13176 / NBRC 15968 / NCIMB 11800 / UQM 2034) TaxID=485918 RepID=A0A979G0L1_CHIPD|nr:carboxypeptidase-like regulatory domain-containing protein [Chitinophaga pinensis]ACU58629.1 hypothetical protein Cpin_1131 [Chitinophaga pinensis DSM 2588]
MKHTAPFTLHIPKPCSENWNQMTPDEKGRFCQHCQEVVVDFSAMSDQEIAGYLSNTSGKTCGKFLPEQLNRGIGAPASNRKPVISIAAMLSALYLFLPEAKASLRPLTEQGTKPLADTSRKKEKPVQLISEINGTILDDENEVLPGATVIIKGTRTGTRTDADGHFHLRLPEPGATYLTLVITYVGFETKEVKVTRPHKNLRIRLDTRTMVLGEYAIVQEKSIWQHLADKVKMMLS